MSRMSRVQRRGISRAGPGLWAGTAGLAIAVFGGVAAWAQPVNDTCITASTVSPGVPVTASTAGAAFNMRTSCDAGGRDLWYVLNIPASGAFLVTLTGDDPSSLTLALVSGCDFPQAEYGCIGTGSGQNPMSLEYQSFGAEPLYIRVGNTGADQNFTLTAGPLPPPANDECTAAAPIALGQTVHGSNLSATTSGAVTTGSACGSIAPGIAAGADVFYTFTPPATGYYDFAMCESVFDSVISVHSGCPATTANIVACNDNARLHRCEDQFTTYAPYLAGALLNAGTTYYVRIAGVLTYDSFTGELGDPGRSPFDLTVTAGSAPFMPANDQCENATVLGENQTAMGSTENSTGSPGECDDSDAFDVWYSYTSTQADRRIVDFHVLAGSFNQQATLSAYDACAGTLLSCEAFNPLTRPDMLMTLAVDPGQNVKIRVAGRSGTQDQFTLQAQIRSAAAANIDCQHAESLLLGQPVMANTYGASSTAPSPCGQDDVYGLWYSFTPTAGGYYRVATDPVEPGLGETTTIAIFAGCGGDVRACATAPDAESVENMAATSLFIGANQTVQIRVALNGPGRTAMNLTVTGPLPAPPALPNDTCAGAVTLASMPFSGQTNISLATGDGSICVSQGQDPVSAPGGIWFRYVPDVDRVFRGRASTPNYQGRVSVFTGPCSSPVQVGCRPAGVFSDPGVRLTAGTEYFILASVDPGFGNELTEIPYGTILSVDFVALPLPANDHCATASMIGSAQAQFSVNTLPADGDAPAPSCAGYQGTFPNAVWYTFTTETAGTLSVHGEAPGDDGFFEPAGALYSGPCGGLVQVACDNPTDGFFLTNHFDFTTTLAAGQSYKLAIGAWNRPVGGQTDVTFDYTGTLATGCAADFNNSGSVTVQDIFDFLNAYFAGNMNADFNNSGSVTVQDIFDFLNAYFAGC